MLSSSMAMVWVDSEAMVWVNVAIAKVVMIPNDMREELREAPLL